jgi:hypothetical protein
MTVLKDLGDCVEGERIVCVFRKMSPMQVVKGSSAHRAGRVVLIGWPCRAVVEKPLRYMKS